MSNQESNNTTGIIISRKENVTAIVQEGPELYHRNSGICQRGLQVGQDLLDKVEKFGMNDNLDREMAEYIAKARQAVTNMASRRSPITKIFDLIRSEFTALENILDPTKKDTVPYRLSKLRDEYASKKRQEESIRRQAEIAAREAVAAREQYRIDVAEDFRRLFNEQTDHAISNLSKINVAVTLDNYDIAVGTVSSFPIELPADWHPVSRVKIPHNVPADTARTIRDEEFDKLHQQFVKQYRFEIGEYRQDILDKLPSKKAELQRLAQATNEEAERIRADLARREAEESERKAREREQAEADARRQAELAKANAQAISLFDTAKASQNYMPKAKVSQKIQINDSAAFLSVVSTWWQHEGCRLSIDELSKIFKKQLTFCEKIANKDNILIESPGLIYVESVKAQ